MSNAKRNSKRQPVYLRAMQMIDPRTGAVVSALVPASGTDQQVIRERGVTIGNVLRADLTQPRNQQFHRLAHAIGGLCVEHIDAFEGLGQHDALKKLQRESGVECDISYIEIPGGGALEHRQPRSMAFDSMDQGQFFQFVSALCGYIARTYWPSCTAEEVEAMADAMVKEAA
ncbi:hypothetical protein [Salinicola sp. DM10]|uniref:hypothetical protein n=1 Tax=Salinicola sp. DM10 TaxID=2815721 RepID=UPI001A8C12B9|nr:hypothetical protein [Salinicola sp. DM10]MCE3025750.1 hypothetical protein [Salinicola sp. DM10]